MAKPSKNTEINDSNVHILVPSGKTKILNVMQLKKIFSPGTNSFNVVPHTEIHDFDFNSKPKTSGLMTQAMKKLFDHKNAV